MEIREQIFHVLRGMTALPERERDVIMRRFGLTTGYPQTLEAVANAYDLSRERVRQIEHHALLKLEQFVRGEG